MQQINQFFAIDKGYTKENIPVTTLYKTGGMYNGHFYELSEPEYIKAFYNDVTPKELEREMILNDWSRWNKELPKGQKVEISEAIYYHLLSCLPPRNWVKNYFEVGEADHHDENGKAIYRACWIEDNKFFTGYPKK